jgi:hypothetical protein
VATLPTPSVATSVTVCWPSESVLALKGEVQLAAAPPSRAQVTVAVSFVEKGIEIVFAAVGF